MGHKRIEVADFLEESNTDTQASAQENKAEAIPLAEVQGYARLQALNTEIRMAQEHLDRTEIVAQRIVKSLQNAGNRLNASASSLCNQLSKQSDSCVSRLSSSSDTISAKFEGDCKKICDDTIERLTRETNNLVNIMSRKAACVPVPQCVFWGVAIILAIALGALSAVAVANHLVLHSQTLWLILAVASFLMCSTVWSIIHFYQKEHGK